MSENQTDVDLIELESLNRTSSLSNNSDSSVSSRSTLIRELITSQTSKQIIDEIDFKISQLVEVIKSKNCNDKRKKYYAKKIVSRIIDNKCSEASIHTLDFRNSDLASSTPYESRDKTPKSFEPHERTPKPQSPEKYKTPSPSNKSPTPKLLPKKLLVDVQLESPTVTKSSDPSPIFYDSTPLTTNKAVDLKQRLKKLAEEIEIYTKTPTSLSPSNEKKISETTDKLEKNLDDLKSIQNVPKKVIQSPEKIQKSPSPQKIETIECQNGRQHSGRGTQNGRQNQFDDIDRQSQNGGRSKNGQKDTQYGEIDSQIGDIGHRQSQNGGRGQIDRRVKQYGQGESQISGIGSRQTQNGRRSKNNPKETQHSQRESQNGGREIQNGCQSPIKVDEEVQTSFEVKLRSPKYGITQNSQKPQNNNNKFDNLTPKTLSLAYKTEFGDRQYKITEVPIIRSEISDGADLNGQNKDWKNYKTTSEKIFEKNQMSRRLAKEYIIKYARKEKERQIEWISNEICSLTKLKEILEKNSVENLSLSSLSSGNNSGSSSKENFNCTGAKTLQEINMCLDELRQILHQKKCIVKKGQKQHESSSSSTNNTDTLGSKTLPPTKNEKNINLGKQTSRNIDSGTESTTSYQVLCKKFTKPTEFEVKYFHESNFLSSGSEDKENLMNFNDNFGPGHFKRNIQVQTSLQSSPKLSREFLGAGDFHSLKTTNSERSNLTKNKSVAYLLTFEETKNGLKVENGLRTVEKTSLEKIVMKIPPPRKQRSKFTSVVPSEMELQEALVRNRNDFVKAAEWRRQCINELTYMRDRRYEDINKRILFTTKEMRDITSKRYKHSAEVQNKIKTEQNQLQKLFNRQLANIFSKKLQKKTLKGQVTIDTAKTVTYDS